MRRRFFTLDVFTDTPLCGNPLAVVLDAQGLDTERMQAIAREFNLSETVFVAEPRDPVNTAAVRIFTPGRELPFAGHPTVGTAVLLAEQRAPELLGRQDLSIVIEETIGLVRCVVRRPRGRTRASFTLPRLPEVAGEALEPARLAAALSIEPSAIGFGRHRPCLMSAGVPYMLVPLAGAEALQAVWPDLAAWPEDLAIFAYTATAGSDGGLAFAARMFAPDAGIHEDPATGSAVAALAGILPEAEDLGEGDHTVTVHQGVAMGRPSVITLGLDILQGRLASASIGGQAVVVAEGTIDL